jgi:hypothetical protein
MSKTQSLITALNERILSTHESDDPDHSLRYLLSASVVALECMTGLHGGKAPIQEASAEPSSASEKQPPEGAE